MLALCGGMVVVAGLEIQTFAVLGALREAGATVHCLFNDWENHRIRPLAEAVGATWSTIPMRGALAWRSLDPRHWLSMAWQARRTSRAVREAARRFRPTHVLVPEMGSALRAAPALAALRREGVEVIFRAGNVPERGRVYRFLWSRVLPRALGRFVANSAFGRRRLIEAGVPEERVEIIHNAVAPRETASQAGAGRADAEIVRLARLRPTLLCLGQIAPFKGTHLAVDAALELLREGRDLQLLVVGRVPAWPPAYARYVRELRRRVTEAGAADRVLFVGERRNVLPILEAGTLLLAPIVQEETFGNVVLEAAAAGLPAVTFDRGGLPELVEHGATGWIAAEPTLEGLLEGTRYFLDRPEERVRAREAARERAGDPAGPYHRRTFARRWTQLFGAPGEAAR